MTNHSNNDSGDFWKALEKEMEEARNRTVGKWRWQPNLDIPQQEAETEWLDLCQRHRLASDMLIRQWIEDPTFQIPDEESKFFVAVRFETLRHHLNSLSFQRTGGWCSPFPQIEKPKAEMMNDLLIDWWWGMGVFVSFEGSWEVATAIE